MRIKIFSCMLATASALAVMSCKDDLTLSADGQWDGRQDDGPSLYMKMGVGFKDALSTRSTTNSGPDDDYASSNSGMEYSSLEEYDVRTAIILLTDKDYNYLAHADVTGILTSDRNTDLEGGDNTGGNINEKNFFSFSTIGRFKYSQIAALYDEDGNLLPQYDDNGTGVRVFVACNPTGDLLNRLESTDFDAEGADKKEWMNWTGEVIQEPSLPGYTPAITNSIWAPRSFLMTNARPAWAELPKKLANWDLYNQEDPFDLSGVNHDEDPDNSESYGDQVGKVRGPVYVERAVGRIDIRAEKSHIQNIPDYKDGKIKEEDAVWRYPILGGLSSSMHDGTTDTDGSLESTNFNFIDVQLTRLSLVNMSKNFYFLRRTSLDGLDNDATPMGTEYNAGGKANYVVDTDAARKQQVNGYDYENASEGFNFSLFTTKDRSNDPNLSREYGYDRNSWYSDNLKDIISNGKLDNTANVDDKYNIWRYVTENTIPQDASGGNSRQVAVQSTGLVYKGLILPGADVDKTFSYQDAASFAGLPAADQEVRYIPEAVVNALLASKYHLPKYGTGENESQNELWVPDPEASDKWDKDKDLTENSKNTKSYNYPTLYVFQGSIYAGFPAVVEGAQMYDGVGGLMYNAVNMTLGNWWARLEDFSNFGDDGRPTNKAVFEFKGTDFNPNSEENSEYHWLQLNVEYYNKIVNNVGNTEPIVQDYASGFKAFAEDFEVVLLEDHPLFREMLTSGSDASRFTMYDASYEEEDRGGAGWGYYCYYFWWLKHNDNGIDGRMGPMEFATVRNNVYKVTVDKISSLGHPLNNLNDPDPLDPETPDEDDKIYIDVNIKVVPWVVRRNSAQF